MLIKKAHLLLLHSHSIPNAEKMSNDFSSLPNSAAFHIIFDENGVCVPTWLGKKYLQGQVPFNNIVMKWMQQSKKEKRSFFYNVVKLYTHLEYVWNGVVFHCHPNYKSNGEWYDWVMAIDTSSHQSFQK